MFDKLLIIDGSLRNVRDGDDVIGFSVDARIAYYRGLGLSMVQADLIVDGQPIARGEVTFAVHGNTYKMTELPAVLEDRWGFTEAATLTVHRLGGLDAGEHTVELIEWLRVSYAPAPTETHDTKVLQAA